MTGILKKIFSLNPFRLSLILVALIVLVYMAHPRTLEILELKALDMRFLFRGVKQPGPEVVIAAIDEKSVRKIGRWPWPRSVFADLVTRMTADGAKVLGFDVVFAEPDANTNIQLIDRLGSEFQSLGLADPKVRQLLSEERKIADNDLVLAEKLKQDPRPVILGYFFMMNQEESSADLSDREMASRIESVKKGRYDSGLGLTSQDVEIKPEMFLRAYLPVANIPLLAQAAGSCGFFNQFPDADGTIRWVPLVIGCRGALYMPLSVQTLRQFLDQAQAMPVLDQAGVNHVRIGSLEVPTDEVGQILVNYRGPQKTFPHFSIADILEGHFPQGTFKDKIVLVGATAVGIYDLRVTPFDSTFPGIEIHANVVDSMLHSDFLYRPVWAPLFDLAAILCFGLILGLTLPRLSAILGLIWGLALLGLWTGANHLMFVRGLWVNFIYPFLALILVYTGITIFRYVTEEREKKKIKGAFSFYVNPSVVSELLRNPDMLKLGGDKKILTVLFSDIRNFTTISEGLDPEALVQLLNQYLTVMTDIIFKYNGLVDKYIGDAIMAVWGAPLDHPDHAGQACRAALEMMTALEGLRAKWAEEDPSIPFIDIGIGLNSGPMVVGNMGSQTRFDYTVMGDAVNLGSRLEGANKQYGTHIIIGDITYEQVSDLLYCRELDSVAVKGKQKPVRIYELLGEKGRVPEDRLDLARTFSRGLVAYKTRQWTEAKRIFSALNCYFPEDKPTEMYLARTTALEKNPPPQNWDGVFVMKTK